MHLPSIFKHHPKEGGVAPAPAEEKHKVPHPPRDDPNLPKGFANDAMRSSSKPDTLYGFDDPTARRLGPLPSTDPTNTGA